MTDGQLQAERGLSDALELVRRKGAIGYELVVTTGDGVSHYSSYVDQDAVAAVERLAAMPVGRTQ